MATDADLMVRMAAGEQSAVELLFARWEGPLFGFFYRLGGHPSWIEDLVEETLVTLYGRRARYDPTRSVAPWVYGIARLVWKDHLRHRGRELYGATSLEEVEDTPAPGPDALASAQRREEEDRVRFAVRRLPIEQREPFILRHYHGLSYDEIAQVVDAPLGTVKWRIHEAVRRLEAHFSRREVRESAE